MNKIADNLRGPALMLWETGLVFNLEPEELAPYVGVPADRINAWFAGSESPTEDEKKKIVAAVRQIDKEIPRAMDGAPVWRAPKLTPEAIAADEDALDAEDAHIARVAEAGGALKASVVGSEAEDLGAAWDGFVRVARAMHERKIQFRI